MAASDEWEIMHLTVGGWVSGGYKLDCGSVREDVTPTNAVLSVRRHVTVGKLGAPSSMKVKESTTKHTSNEDEIEQLLAKYGKPPFGV